jgi:hypothetical protein
LHFIRIVLECLPGTRPGKILGSPVTWLALNASLDGLDPNSTNPLDRILYATYQRRTLLSCLKDKATLLALCGNTEAAAKVAEVYLSSAMPVGKLAAEVQAAAVEEQLREIENMEPQHARAISDEELMRKARAIKPIFKDGQPSVSRGTVTAPRPLPAATPPIAPKPRPAAK